MRSKSKDPQITRISLLESLKSESPDDLAWRRFYDLYAPLITGFAIKRGCAKEQAQDVMQETSLALLKKIKSFDYDADRGRFKSFLFKIAESKVVDAFRKSQAISKLKSEELFRREGAGAGTEESAALWDAEWEEHLLRQSMEMAKKEVKPSTFACFEETFLKGNAVAETAKKLKISGNLVSQHKHKVLKKILAAAEKLLSLSPRR